MMVWSGWSDNACTAFMLGSGEVLGEGPVVFQSDETVPAAAAMRREGCLEDWRSHVAVPSRNNPLMMVAISLAFSGSLLEPLGMEGGGVHLRGASSRGKSTIMGIGASVWGSPDIMRTWRATSNGLEGVATAYNSTLLPLDELGDAPSPALRCWRLSSALGASGRFRKAAPHTLRVIDPRLWAESRRMAVRRGTRSRPGNEVIRAGRSDPSAPRPYRAGSGLAAVQHGRRSKIW